MKLRLSGASRNKATSISNSSSNSNEAAPSSEVEASKSAVLVGNNDTVPDVKEHHATGRKQEQETANVATGDGDNNDGYDDKEKQQQHQQQDGDNDDEEQQPGHDQNGTNVDESQQQEPIIKLYKSPRLKGYITIALASVINFNAAILSTDPIASNSVPASITQQDRKSTRLNSSHSV